MMSEDANSQTSKPISFMEREDWIVLLTGGLVSSSAIGWLVYKDFKSQQLDKKALMTIAASFAGGISIYFTGSAIIYMWRKSWHNREESIAPKKDASGLTALEGESSLCEKFANLVIQLENVYASETSKVTECKDLENTTSMNIQETAEVPGKSEMLHDLKRKEPRTELKLLINNQIKTSLTEDIGSRKAKFREEILSYINELNGYVQGAINPLPLASNIQSRLTGTGNEVRRQVVMIVKEYVNSMVPKLEQVIDDFVDSVSKAANIPDYDKEDKVKKAFETLGVSKNDISSAQLKIEMDQYYNTLANSIKSNSPTLSRQNDQLPKFALSSNMQPLHSIPSPSLHKDALFKISECSLPVMPKLASPTSADIPFKSRKAKTANHCTTSTSIPFKSREAETANHLTLEKPKVPLSNKPAKLTLSEEQMNYLNLLKSEM